MFEVKVVFPLPASTCIRNGLNYNAVYETCFQHNKTDLDVEKE